MTQLTLELRLEQTPSRSAMSVRASILEAMNKREWWRLEELAYYHEVRTGKRVSDCTVSARLREPGLEHETRPRGKGSSAVEYRLKSGL